VSNVSKMPRITLSLKSTLSALPALSNFTDIGRIRTLQIFDHQSISSSTFSLETIPFPDSNSIMSLIEPSPPPADLTPPPNKRRKAKLACHPCRARKTGCDGHRPHCSSCVMRGWQDRCGYQEKEILSFPSTPAPSVLLI